MMVNFKLGDKCDKGEIIDMTRAWDKEKKCSMQEHVIHELSFMTSLSMSSRGSLSR